VKLSVEFVYKIIPVDHNLALALERLLKRSEIVSRIQENFASVSSISTLDLMIMIFLHAISLKATEKRFEALSGNKSFTPDKVRSWYPFVSVPCDQFAMHLFQAVSSHGVGR